MIDIVDYSKDSALVNGVPTPPGELLDTPNMSIPLGKKEKTTWTFISFSPRPGHSPPLQGELPEMNLDKSNSASTSPSGGALGLTCLIAATGSLLIRGSPPGSDLRCWGLLWLNSCHLLSANWGVHLPELPHAPKLLVAGRMRQGYELFSCFCHLT